MYLQGLGNQRTFFKGNAVLTSLNSSNGDKSKKTKADDGSSKKNRGIFIG